MDQFYYSVRGERQGPVSLQQLRDMLARGEITSESMIWAVGDSNWVKVAKHPAFANTAAMPPPLPPMTRAIGAIRKAGQKVADVIPSVILGVIVALIGLATAMFFVDRSRVPSDLLAIIVGAGFIASTVVCALIFFPRRSSNVLQPGPYRRAIARFIDFALTSALIYGAAIWVLQRILADDFDHRAESFRVSASIILAVVWLGIHQALFEAVCQGLFGNTPGRALGGYQIRASNGNAASAWAVAIRSLKVWFVGVCAVLPPVAPFLMAYWYRRYREGKPLPWDNPQSGIAVSTGFGVGRVIGIVIVLPLAGVAALALGKVVSEFTREVAALPDPRKVASAKVLLPASDGNKWGWIDERGEFVIPPRFDKVRRFEDGLAWASSNGKWQLVDMRGRPVSQNSFDAIGRCSEGLCAVEKSRKWGFVDRRGEIVIPFEFKNVGWFSEGLAAVVTKGGSFGADREKWKLGFIDRTGSFVIEPRFEGNPDRYSVLPEFKNGIAVVRMRVMKERASGSIDEHEKYYAIRKDGSLAFDLDRVVSGALGGKYKEFRYPLRDASRGSDGSIIISFMSMKNFSFHGVLFVSSNGVPLFPPVMGVLSALPYEEGYAQIDKVVEDDVFAFNRGLRSRVGFLDRSGRIAIPTIYEEAFSFSEGLAAVKIGGKWGFIEPTGRFAIEPRFASGGFFRDGFALVVLTERTEGVIDRAGNVVRSWPR